MDEISIEKARPSLGEIVDRARLAGTLTTITRQSKPAAVVVPVEWYVQVQALLTDLEDLHLLGGDLDGLMDREVSARNLRASSRDTRDTGKEDQK